MRPIFFLLVVLFSFAPNKGFTQENENFYRQLAAHHAPIVVQEVGKKPKADAITRFDFDGDFVANNNWDNLNYYPTPAYVYYDVMETLTHYFVFYALFHPRDYSSVFCVPRVCHENDLEGILITVQKDPLDPMGKVIFLETLAHLTIKKTKNPIYLRVDELIDTQKGDTLNARAVVQVEQGGHGIYPFKKLPKKFLVYSYGGISEDPDGAKSGHFLYDLISLDQLWSLREERGLGRTFLGSFDYRGFRFTLKDLPKSIAGQKHGKGLASPPWGWGDFNFGSRGDWFLDPAYWVYQRLDRPLNFSLTYLHHPYILGNPNKTDIDIRAPASENP